MPANRFLDKPTQERLLESCLILESSRHFEQSRAFGTQSCADDGSTHFGPLRLPLMTPSGRLILIAAFLRLMNVNNPQEETTIDRINQGLLEQGYRFRQFR